MDAYANFSELSVVEVEDKDYRISAYSGVSNVLILAPHGGKIERGTSQIALAIAGCEHSCYCFDGIKPGLKPNRVLHITSNRFDEPKAISMVEKACSVITIHGARGEERAVYFGGLDQELRRIIADSLRDQGFYACDDPSPSRQGVGVTNICNRGQSGKGLQIELTFGLRKTMFVRTTGKPGWRTTDVFSKFVVGGLGGRSYFS